MATEETIKIVADTGNAIAGIDAVAVAGAKMGSSLQGIGGTLVGLGAKVGLFTAPLALGLGAATKNAIDFDQAMSGASRALDLSGKEVEDFKRQALAIAPPLGLLPEKFAELATEAGKLGVAKKDIIDFAKVIAETAAITDADAIKLSSSFAALQTITGASGKQLEIFGAAVNKLDDNVGGTTPDIIEFTRQTAATGKLLKLGIKDLAAYGSTMASLGIQNGVAYRSFNGLLNKLAASHTLSKKGQLAFRDLGLDAQQMARIMTTNANQGIEIFLTAIQKVAAVDTSRALGAVKQIVGGDYNDEILTLALSHQKLATALTYTSDAYDAANLQKKNDELAKKLGNVKGQTAVMQAQMQRLGITLGSAVLPNLNDLLGMMTPLIDKFAVFAETHPGIVKVGMAIAAVTLSISPLLIGIGSVISAVGTIGTILPAIAPMVTAIGSAFAVATSPVWLTVGAFVAVGAAIGVLAATWRNWLTIFEDGSFVINFFGKKIAIGIFADIDKAFSNAGKSIRDWVYFTGEKLQEASQLFSGMANRVSAIALNLGSNLIAFFQPPFEFIKSLVTNTVMLMALPYIKLGTLMLSGVNTAIALVKPPIQGFITWFSASWNQFSSGYISGVLTMTTWVGSQWQAMTAKISASWNKFSSGYVNGVLTMTTWIGSQWQWISNQWQAMTGKMGGGWNQFSSNYMNGVAVLVSYANQSVNSISGIFTGLWNWFSSFVGNFYNAGQALVINLTQGIRASFYQAINEFNQQLAYLRGLLPGSEPRYTSPLSNLAAAGTATMENFASGFTSSDAPSLMSGVLGDTRSQMSPAFAMPSGGNQPIVINDNRTFNLGTNGTNNGNIDIIETLKKSDRELLDLIEKARARWNRGR